MTEQRTFQEIAEDLHHSWTTKESEWKGFTPMQSTNRGYDLVRKITAYPYTMPTGGQAKRN